VPLFGRRTQAPAPVEHDEPERPARPTGGPPMMIADLQDGPLAGRSVEVESIEGRPPKTVDVAADDGMCRYCLAEWEQTGRSAAYTFLYRL
jgi:hypothetical protein